MWIVFTFCLLHSAKYFFSLGAKQRSNSSRVHTGIGGNISHTLPHGKNNNGLQYIKLKQQANSSIPAVQSIYWIFYQHFSCTQGHRVLEPMPAVSSTWTCCQFITGPTQSWFSLTLVSMSLDWGRKPGKNPHTQCKLHTERTGVGINWRGSANQCCTLHTTLILHFLLLLQQALNGTVPSGFCDEQSKADFFHNTKSDWKHFGQGWRDEIEAIQLHQQLIKNFTWKWAALVLIKYGKDIKKNKAVTLQTVSLNEQAQIMEQ